MKETFSGRYKISEKIGAGGMADVYKGYDKTLERTVAIKVLYPQFAQEENFVARFRREAQAAAALNHPNIVNVYDWGKENGTYFIVMEYLAGRSLKEILEERGALPEVEALSIAKQILEALEAAHNQEVIHRDIKPGNIIITPEGKVKVTDFGIARAGGASTMAMTQPGQVMGTAQYIAPEQAKGLLAEAPSDLYSLGVVLYEMLTGRVPFEGEQPVAVAWKHLQEEPLPPRTLNPAISKSLETVILKALVKNPEARYSSAKEFREDLEKISQGAQLKKKVPAAEKTVVLPTPILPQTKRRRALIFSLLLIMGLLVLSAGAYLGVRLVALSGVKVPQVEGKTVAQARQVLAEKGLKLKVQKEVESEEVAKGFIVSQDPEAGERLRREKTVNVVVSLGSTLVKVPKVVGESIEEATELLVRSGLKLGSIKRAFSHTVPEDFVISQNPPPSAGKVKRGTSVNLTVSKGEELISVPEVTGKSEEEAIAFLEKKGFKVQAKEESSEEVAQGYVIRQSPSAGVKAEKGTTVTLTVSSGSSEVTVPNVVGDEETAARDELKSLGFTVTVKKWPSTPENYGKVVSQDPEAGEKATKGGAVTIWIGQAP